ncbi:Os05g0171450 [Oryza sativa Japonica Group]|uniref:Os05g0171450 protein n=1 Tax=Oryza sativa subsp. japonica TaxID=39947 RepID=A0A0P0WII1_ORYSJ|nr:Os05g0171450 [Oryza sativa Japonica Group]
MSPEMWLVATIGDNDCGWDGEWLQRCSGVETKVAVLPQSPHPLLLSCRQECWRRDDSDGGYVCGLCRRRERPWFTGWRQLSSFVATSYDVGDGGRLRCWCRVVLCMDFGFFLEKGPPVWCPLAIGTCAVAMR